MAVRRIVANIAADDLSAAKAFYGDVLGLDLAMNHGWIITFAGAATASVQISFATEGGAGTLVPDISIEVDDVDAVYDKVISAGFPVEYGPANEEWGVRRFYVRDPFGRLINILAHKE